MLDKVLEQREEAHFDRTEVLNITVEMNEEGAYSRGERKEGESAGWLQWFRLAEALP